VIVDLERIDPGGFLDKLHGRRAAIKLGKEWNGGEKADHRTDQGDTTHYLSVFVIAHRKENKTENNRQPNSDG
jgi:hypothetical protein